MRIGLDDLEKQRRQSIRADDQGVLPAGDAHRAITAGMTPAGDEAAADQQRGEHDAMQHDDAARHEVETRQREHDERRRRNRHERRLHHEHGIVERKIARQPVAEADDRENRERDGQGDEHIPQEGARLDIRHGQTRVAEPDDRQGRERGAQRIIDAHAGAQRGAGAGAVEAQVHGRRGSLVLTVFNAQHRFATSPHGWRADATDKERDSRADITGTLRNARSSARSRMCSSSQQCGEPVNER